MLRRRRRAFQIRRHSHIPVRTQLSGKNRLVTVSLSRGITREPSSANYIDKNLKPYAGRCVRRDTALGAMNGKVCEA